MNFNAGSQSLGRGGLEGRRGSRSQLSFSRKFPFVKSTEKLNEFTEAERKHPLPFRSFILVHFVEIRWRDKHIHLIYKR